MNFNVSHCIQKLDDLRVYIPRLYKLSWCSTTLTGTFYTSHKACTLLDSVTMMINVANQRDASPLSSRNQYRGKHGKFLHITDIHIDPYYLKGSDPKTSCHRMTQNNTFHQVGFFGAPGTFCDSPQPLVDATFEFLKNQVQDIDFIIYTGDTVRHDRDVELNRTKQDVLREHKAGIAYFQNAYDLNQIPMIPTIGNNDAFEHDDVVGFDPILNRLKKIWAPLDLNLDDKSFNMGGYFIQDLIEGKLSVINLNAMYFYKPNSHVSDCNDTKSPGYIELKWFESVLKDFKDNKKGYQVYVMSHMSPVDVTGASMYKEHCYNEYLDLLGKYGSIISGHFTGHTNTDNLVAVISSFSNSKPGYAYIAPDSANVTKNSLALKQSPMAIFNAPSIIPAVNPGFRVYHYDLDGKDYSVGTIRDWEQYYVDLERANEQDGQIVFELEYTASDFYGVDHFDGPGVGQAILNVASNTKALELYTHYINVSFAPSSS